jgi:hypothetical protein
MSVNLHLSFEVRGYAPEKYTQIIEAIMDFLTGEQLERDFGPVQAVTDMDGTPVLRSRTDPRYPVIISRSYIWLPEITKSFEAAVTQANGGPCEVSFHGDDAD